MQINDYLEESKKVIDLLRHQKDMIERMVSLFGGRIFVCGNGGSSATASVK